MATYYQEPTEGYLSLKRRFSDFIHEYQPRSADRYIDRIEPLFDDKKAGKNVRLLIDVHDLQQFDDKLHQGLLKDPCESIRPCIDAARDAAKGLNEGTFGQKHASEVEVCIIFWKTVRTSCAVSGEASCE
jgi:DNA replicative helicase MCM subunit Mcm2 (Cdc46/Mcm family)